MIHLSFSLPEPGSPWRRTWEVAKQGDPAGLAEIDLRYKFFGVNVEMVVDDVEIISKRRFVTLVDLALSLSHAERRISSGEDAAFGFTESEEVVAGPAPCAMSAPAGRGGASCAPVRALAAVLCRIDGELSAKSWRPQGDRVADWWGRVVGRLRLEQAALLEHTVAAKRKWHGWQARRNLAIYEAERLGAHPAEIARRTGLKVGTVKTLIRNGKKAKQEGIEAAVKDIAAAEAGTDEAGA
ncbi:hypothetical protein GCM10010129_07750 [Streptomyces fumigatiscleroticus]|nr:hypothetical protein GCM10010129_07750 [Streptomyces fumigatiscleroticus]